MAFFSANLVLVLLVLGFCTSLFISWMAYRAIIQRPIARWLVPMMLGAAIWSIADILIITLPDFEQKRTALPFVYMGVALILWSLPLFALQYVGLRRYTTSRWILILAIEPLLLLLFTLTNPLHQLFWLRTNLVEVSNIVLLENTYGPLFWFHTAYAYVVLLVSTAALSRALLRAHQRQRTLSALVVLGVLMPWIGNALFLSRFIPFDLTSLAFAITGFSLSLGIVRYRLLDVTPIARDTVIEVMNDAVLILDNDFRLVDLNKAAWRIFTPPKNPNGLELRQLSPELADLTETSRLDRTLDHPIQFGTNHYEIRFSPLRYANRWPVGWMILLHDVTLARQTQAELEAERDFALQVMNNMGQGLTVTNKDSKFIYVNPAYGRITGYRPEDVLGKSPLELTHDADREILIEARKKRQQGERSTHEHRFIRADGTVAYGLVTGVPRFKNGEFDGSIAVVTDLTEQKRIESELRQARDEAMQASQMKSVFLATMSHELRTPLTAIMGYAELQLAGITGPLNPEQHEFNERILVNSRHLLTIINQVLDISKIEAGRLELTPVTFQPCSLVDEVLRQTASLVGDKAIELCGECLGLPEHMVGDPDRLRQILLNLVSNAIKFTQQGQVSIHLRRAGEQAWIMRVQDTGIGIPASALPHIFEEFRQVDAAITRQHEGTGLGLAIVQKLTRLMGGEVQVVSEVNAGSTFTICLPLVTP
ncbi:MAG: PAS domain S-box protein [Anaerolineae bacterium]|nr:PAS domain S-box protein [Anaerolineae bacterium]